MNVEFDLAWKQMYRYVLRCVKRLEIVEECYNDSLYKIMTTDTIINDKIAFYKTIIRNEALNALKNIRKDENNLFHLEDVSNLSVYDFSRGWEDFVIDTRENETDETTELYEKLEMALTKLTNKQREAILKENNFGTDRGRKSNTERNNRKHALMTLRREMGIGINVALTDKQKFYLNIHEQHERGEIGNLKDHLKKNNLTYSTYYVMVKNAKNKLLQTKKENT